MEFKSNTISKEDFFSINEDDVMFITNPGRMGDEDGSTFILKEDDVFKIYRLDVFVFVLFFFHFFLSKKDEKKVSVF